MSAVDGRMNEAAEESLNLNQYWGILQRRRRWIAGICFLVWAAAFGVTWLLPPKYISETTILVEQQKVPEHYVVPNISSDLQSQLQSLTQQILSRTRLQHIVDELHLYSLERGRLSSESLIGRMRNDIKVDPIPTPGRPDELTAFKISYSGPNGRLAQQVTTRLASLFIEENLKRREQQSEDTTQFLQDQLEDARTHLEQQEAKVREYKMRYLGQLPTQMQTNIQLLSGLDNRLQNANDALNRAEQQKLYFTSLLEQYRSMASMVKTDSGAPASPPALEIEIARLKQRLANLQTQFTDKHPDIQQLRDEIAKDERLKAQIDKELKHPDATALASTGGPESSVSAEVESQLKATELEISNRKKEIAQIELEMHGVQDRLDSTPVREQQLADLTRDYDQSRAYYESLLAKRNQSEMATNLEKLQEGEQFSVLDPPSLPTKPHFPNRLKFSLGGLAAGLALGLASAYAAELADDRVHSAADLDKIYKGAVLVTIPTLPNPRAARNRRWQLAAELSSGMAMFAIIAAATLMSFLRG